ncbi:MAG: hypothetical protein QHC78_17065 [Pigmentiphaga sp.]|uniref:hypothetical protein n=1 Tax=Pigmentiphaga sp. TaxID=1977564 RepID=UPI0029AEC4F9|nr:hypothetical protein [Pigmentiphaga sp.]MDX3907403.1 hypothetical protein [Pigmentiphaga sp.]
MVVAVSHESAVAQSAPRIREGVIPAHRTEYMGAHPHRGGASLPQAFTIEMHPLQEVGAHYHRVPQYQVFLSGNGRIGRHPTRPYAIHYSDPYTGYGPLVAAEQPMVYMTLRPLGDPGPTYMTQPGAREQMRPSRRRFLLATAEAATIPAAGESRVESLIDRHDDGVEAGVYRLGAGATITGPDPTLGGGHYFLVLTGTLQHAGAAYGPRSTVFVEAGEDPLTLLAGPAGVELLFLQFPRVEG